MTHVSAKRPILVLGLLLFGGCLSPVREHVDAVVCEMAARPLDLVSAPVRDSSPPMPPAQDGSKTASAGSTGAAASGRVDPDVRQTAWQVGGGKAGAGQPGTGTQPSTTPGGQPTTPGSLQQPNLGKSGIPTRPGEPGQTGLPSKGRFQGSLRMPESLPGGNPDLVLPNKREQPQAWAAAVKALFPELPPLEPLPQPQPGPYGHPLTLSELQQIALARNPLIRQAAADVEAAKGAARQAGAYPNPNVGYEADNVNSAGTAGFQGVFVEQLIKTAGKLKTAQASSLQSLANAQLALRRAQTDLMAQVRAGYFALLVAHYALQVNTGLREHTERIYEFFRAYVQGGLRPPYEAIELRALTLTARTTLTQARNRYLTAWRQLAATLGDEHLPLTEVAGNAEMEVPRFQRDLVLAYVLSSHTDILTARNTQQKGRYDLRLAQVTPCPDVDVRVVVQKDFSTPPFNIAHNVQFGFALPVWDQNEGAIAQAQGTLLRATEEEHRVRLDLATRLADAFERYETNRRLAEYYRERVLPDYKRVFNLVLNLFAVQSDKDNFGLQFLDIINNQQLYVTAVATYLNTLTGQWQAVADVASLMQIDELYLPVEEQKPLPVPDSGHLPPLPCSHPCDPLLNPVARHDAGPPLPAVVGKEELLPAPRTANPGP